MPKRKRCKGRQYIIGIRLSDVGRCEFVYKEMILSDTLRNAMEYAKHEYVKSIVDGQGEWRTVEVGEFLAGVFHVKSALSAQQIIAYALDAELKEKVPEAPLLLEC